ncbi:MAG: hypothetical protein LQ351_003582 [Letrouitia transgressa]|nr:MAG: hypothetical protein LQ351_003582 [Letrouitia transgressa]
MQPTPEPSPVLQAVDTKKSNASPTLKASAPNTRACQACRQRKVRCLPAQAQSQSQSEGRCQRCTQSGRECIVLAPSKRRRRKRTDTRVAELEKMVKELSEKLEQGRFANREPHLHHERIAVNVPDLEATRATSTSHIHSPNSSAASKIIAPRPQASPAIASKLDPPDQLVPSNTPATSSEASLTPKSYCTELSMDTTTSASSLDEIPVIPQSKPLNFLPLQLPNLPTTAAAAAAVAAAEFSPQQQLDFSAPDATPDFAAAAAGADPVPEPYNGPWIFSPNSIYDTNMTPDPMSGACYDWSLEHGNSWLYLI